MKRKILSALICFSFFSVIFTGLASASTGCNDMKLTYIGIDAVWVKNVGSSKCANIAVNGSQYFKLDPDSIDRLMAIALTAMSLDKTVWVDVLGTAQGSIMDLIAISAD